MSDNVSPMDYRLPIFVGLAVGVASVAVLYTLLKKKDQSLSVDEVDGSRFLGRPGSKSEAPHTKKTQESTVLRTSAAKPTSHVKARGPAYPRESALQKASVPDDRVSWSTDYPGYSPVDYTAPSVAAQPVWADPDIRTEKCLLQWNAVDGDTDRRSHTGDYAVVNGVPRNPVGRTGMVGRGLLGKWGPNHAADPIVTRWKRDADNQIVHHPETNKPVLQFVSIQRKDSGEWAIPGGMVEAGESVSMVLKKEFAEEAMNMLEQSDSQKQQTQKIVDEFFNGGHEVYRGYVDDPRNTDNAWMETVVVNFQDETGEGVGKFHLHAGDDAGAVQWADVDGSLKLYASHTSFLEVLPEIHDCHW